MKKYFIFIIFISLIFSCTTTDKSVKKETKIVKPVAKFKNDVNINISKSVGWVNLMPGSDPKFHVSGIFSLLNGEGYSLESTELKYVKVYQFNKELYYIMPKVIDEVNQNERKISYSTIRGLSINTKLNINEPVVFELIFKDQKDELFYRVNNIMIEEVH